MPLGIGALAGAVLISALTSSFLSGIATNPQVPESVTQEANVKLAGGAPFVSDKDLQTALEKAGVPQSTAAAIEQDNTKARLVARRASLAVLAVIALLALFLTGGIPERQPASARAP